MIAEHHVAQARRHTAVHHRGHAVCLGQSIQLEWIFAEKRDVYDVLSRLDDRPERRKTHKPRHSADHQVGAAHDALDDLRAGQIGHLPGERVLGRQGLHALPAGVHGRDAVLAAQVGGDRAAHHARAQNHDVFHMLSFGVCTP